MLHANKQKKIWKKRKTAGAYGWKQQISKLCKFLIKRKYNMQLSNKQYLTIMKSSIVDFKIGMLQGGEVGGKEK